MKFESGMIYAWGRTIRTLILTKNNAFRLKEVGENFDLKIGKNRIHTINISPKDLVISNKKNDEKIRIY
jgi:hypothetical protein